jgi:hypothetical protein
MFYHAVQNIYTISALLVSKTRARMKWRYLKKGTATNKQCFSVTKNIFAELEYISSSAAHTVEVAQVHNLVGTSRVVSHLHRLDLRAISHLIPNAKFEKQKFAAITIRLGQPVCTVLLFTSGKWCSQAANPCSTAFSRVLLCTITYALAFLACILFWKRSRFRTSSAMLCSVCQLAVTSIC